MKICDFCGISSCDIPDKQKGVEIKIDTIIIDCQTCLICEECKKDRGLYP